MKAEDIAWIENATKALEEQTFRLDNHSNNLGTVIMIERVRHGMTLGELSDLSGVSKSHLSRVENGKRRPSSKVFKKISGD